MYNGFGGNYGRMGAGGGQEMMLIMVCCVCCLCIASLVGLYWTNAMCSVSTSLGRSCQPATSAPYIPPAVPVESITPVTGTSTGSVTQCSKQVAPAKRTGPDPRPEIQPSACQSESRVTGRDCFYWKVEADNLSGMARWVRVNEDDGESDLLNPNCKPLVKCDNKIKFNDPEMTLYREDSPASMLRIGKCQVITAPTNTRSSTILAITRLAKSLAVKTWTVGDWTKLLSTVVYDKIEKYIGQNDLTAVLRNLDTTGKALKAYDMFNENTIPMDAFAYMLEAAVRTLNDASWVYNNTLLLKRPEYRSTWQGQPSRQKWNYYIQCLQRWIFQVQRSEMQNWTVILYTEKAQVGTLPDR